MDRASLPFKTLHLGLRDSFHINDGGGVPDLLMSQSTASQNCVTFLAKEASEPNVAWFPSDTNSRTDKIWFWAITAATGVLLGSVALHAIRQYKISSRRTRPKSTVSTDTILKT